MSGAPPSFRWLARPAAGAPPGCAHDPAACNCFASGAATQSLDELEFARSACAAAAAGQAEKLAAILRRAPDAVHSDGGRGTSGYTPLHYAARAGRAECAELLIRAGAAVDARTVQGRATPLHRAAHEGHHDLVDLLIRHGADGTRRDADGETPLHKAAAQGHAATASRLLAAFPSAAAARDRRGRTPREAAAGAALGGVDWPAGGGGATGDGGGGGGGGG